MKLITHALVVAALCAAATVVAAGQMILPPDSKLALGAPFCLHEYETADAYVHAQDHCLQLDPTGWAKYDMTVLGESRVDGKRVLNVRLSRTIQQTQRLERVKGVCGNQVTGFFECTRIEFAEGAPKPQRDEMSGWVRCVDIRAPGHKTGQVC